MAVSASAALFLSFSLVCLVPNMPTLDLLTDREQRQAKHVPPSPSPVAYMLFSARETCYIGSTIEMEHRLRQHNGWVAGGAHRTTKNRPWSLMLQVEGFGTYAEAHRFETDWHFPERCFGLTPIQQSFYADIRLGNRSFAVHVEVLSLLLKARTERAEVPHLTVRSGTSLNALLALPALPAPILMHCHLAVSNLDDGESFTPPAPAPPPPRDGHD